MESKLIRTTRNVRFYLAEIGGSPVPVVTIKNKEGFAGAALDHSGRSIANGRGFATEGELCSFLLSGLRAASPPE